MPKISADPELDEESAGIDKMEDEEEEGNDY